MSQTPILHALSAAVGAADAEPDAELLRRFADASDHSAFELVVRRHAELVWGVCRAALPRDPHAAEDAFQATFLVLARRAGAIRDGSAAGWLFRVARNVAVRARARAARRLTAPLPEALTSGGSPVEDDAARNELAPVVAEEVDRLAAKLRDPVVLCFFEGHTHAEAAARLGWPVGTVASRLARAKDVLRDRLTRRGVVLPAAGLAAVFATAPATAGASAVAPRVAAALAIATGPAERIPPAVLSLTQGVISAMRYSKLKLVAVLVVIATGLSVAFAAVPGRTQPVDAPPGAPGLPAEPPKKAADGKPEEDKRLKALQGKWRRVQATNGGHEVPVDELAARPPVAVKGDQLVAGDRVEDVPPLTMEIRFPTGAGPQAIDFVFTGGPKQLLGTTMPGLYKLEGDTLTLCTRDLEQLKKGRPADFKPDEANAVSVLERLRDEKGELRALAGEWAGVTMYVSGKEVPADEVAKMKWVIDGSDVLLTGEGEKGEKATLQLDPATTPPTFDLAFKEGTRKGGVLIGLYFRQPNRLTLCFRDPRVMNAAPPSELKPGKEGEGVVFVVFERKPKK